MTMDIADAPQAPALRELADRCFEGIERHIAMGGQLTDDHLAQLQMVLGPNLAKALQLVDASAAASEAAQRHQQERQDEDEAAAAREEQQEQEGQADAAAGARRQPPPRTPAWLPHNPVTRVRAASGAREAFWVSAGGGGGGGGGGGRPGSGGFGGGGGPEQQQQPHYVTLPRAYCSCQSYHFEVATRSVAPFCKHQIAARLCAALGCCSDLPDVPDATLAAMLLYG